MLRTDLKENSEDVWYHILPKLYRFHFDKVCYKCEYA